MKTFNSPPTAPPIGEFVYEGCRYSGIVPGSTFSVLSNGLAEFLTEMFPFLVESDKPAPVADNEYCCSKCNKDCGSKYMKDRHEKVCKEEPQGLATIMKPTYIFWNYKGLDLTQLTPDQLIPPSVSNFQPQPQFNEKDITDPMPGKEGFAMIGKRMEKVVTDRDGIDWYGNGLEDDPVR